METLYASKLLASRNAGTRHEQFGRYGADIHGTPSDILRGSCGVCEDFESCAASVWCA